ncbi:MAG: hypothetical protein DCO81_04915 [Candidatus Aquiluna sp. XM-24bin5]|nr:MAG: hypothetical protein DCO81_04915 [Candidatus Aquiluna sp. XM-24bin5]
MRSVETTREQLLTIAVEMFAANGFAQTSLRAIAKQAGVSPALLVHHFGTKDALIKEAMAITLGHWVADEKAAMLDDESNQLSHWQTVMAKGATPLNFFRQVLLAGGEYSQRLFAAAVSESESLLEQMKSAGRLRDVKDPKTTALMLTLSGLGSVLFMDHIEKILGGSIASEPVAKKLMNANNQMLQEGIFVPSSSNEKEAGN